MKSRYNCGLVAALIAFSATSLAGCDKQARQQVKAESKDVAASAKVAIDDGAITTKVKSAMLADDHVKGLDISVETKDGVVKLTGRATSPSEKERAVQIARNVDGVKAVNDGIAVN